MNIEDILLVEELPDDIIPNNMWEGIFCHIAVNDEMRYKCIMWSIYGCIKSECGKI